MSHTAWNDREKPKNLFLTTDAHEFYVFSSVFICVHLWKIPGKKSLLRFPVLARPWVRLVIHLRQMLKIEMGIDLGGADIGMSEQLLYGAQVTR